MGKAAVTIRTLSDSGLFLYIRQKLFGEKCRPAVGTHSLAYGNRIGAVWVKSISGQRDFKYIYSNMLVLPILPQ